MEEAQHLEFLSGFWEFDWERQGKHLFLPQFEGGAKFLWLDKSDLRLLPPCSWIMTLNLSPSPSFSSLRVIDFFNLLAGVVGTIILALYPFRLYQSNLSSLDFLLLTMSSLPLYNGLSSSFSALTQDWYTVNTLSVILLRKEKLCPDSRSQKLNSCNISFIFFSNTQGMVFFILRHPSATRMENLVAVERADCLVIKD